MSESCFKPQFQCRLEQISGFPSVRRGCFGGNAQILRTVELFIPILGQAPARLGFRSQICGVEALTGCLLQLEMKHFTSWGSGKTKGFWCERPSSAAAAASASRTAPPLSPLITQHSAAAAYIQFHTAAKKIFLDG